MSVTTTGFRGTAGRAAVVAVCAIALTGCEGEAPAAAGANDAPAAEIRSEAPRPGGQIETRNAAVVGRALAANGRAEAQVVEASRANGVLTLRVRFQRAPGADGHDPVYYGSPASWKDNIYVTAGDKKYFLLADTEGDPLASDDLTLRLDEDIPVAATWFGKFPAPGPEIGAISLVLPEVEPLDNIPVSDR